MMTLIIMRTVPITRSISNNKLSSYYDITASTKITSKITRHVVVAAFFVIIHICPRSRRNMRLYLLHMFINATTDNSNNGIVIKC
jgi:GTP cyclohydrolase FolE2